MNDLNTRNEDADDRDHMVNNVDATSGMTEHTPWFAPSAAKMASAALFAAVSTPMVGCTTTISPAQAARFLQQAQFSSTEAEIAQLVAVGYDAWLTQQMALPLSTTIRGWNWLHQQGYSKAEFKFDARPIDHMIWHQLITAKDTLRKRVALALSEIFVASIEGMNGEHPALTMAAYWDVLNTNAFGNYATLISQLSTNLAMGRYLSLRGSKKEDANGRRPDENFARELLQLFSIGLHKLNLDGTLVLDATGKPIETYNQSQITELAKIFTGFEENRSTTTATSLPYFSRLPMKMIDADHSFVATKVFNRTIAAGTAPAEAIRLALYEVRMHPNVGPFLSKQLIQRLVCSNPSPAYVSRVASIFNNQGTGVRGDLKSVIKAILLDPEARTDPNPLSVTQGKVREPVLRLVQWARTFNATSVSGKWLIGNLSSPQWRLAQSPLRAPSVFNFFKPSFSTTALTTKQCVAPELQLLDESSVAAYVNFMKDVVDKGVPRYDDWRVSELVTTYSSELALVTTPAALVTRLNLLLCANQLSAATQTLILNAVSSISTNKPDWQKNRVWCAVLLTMVCAEYQVMK